MSKHNRCGHKVDGYALTEVRKPMKQKGVKIAIRPMQRNTSSNIPQMTSHKSNRIRYRFVYFPCINSCVGAKFVLVSVVLSHRHLGGEIVTGKINPNCFITIC